MEDITTAREKILKKVRAGLLNKFAAQLPDVEMESTIYTFSDPDRAVAFGKEFTANGGGFVYCHNEFDFRESLMIWMDKLGVKQLLVSEPELRKELQNLGLPVGEAPEGEHSVTLLQAEAVIARNGTIVLSSAGTRRELLHATGTIAVVAGLSRLCDDMKQAFTLFRNRYGERLPGMMSFINGSIEGPGGKQRELVLFLINDRV